MFLKFVEFPPIKEGKEQDVKDWFKKSNAIFSKFDGFISLRLFVSAKGLNVGLLEHQSKEIFLKMHNSKEQAEWAAQAATMFDGASKASLFEVVEL